MVNGKIYIYLHATKSQPKEMLPIVDSDTPCLKQLINCYDEYKTSVLGVQTPAIYAYDFEGRRYDVGDKLEFLEATVDFVLKRPELREEFIAFLKSKNESQEIQALAILDEVALDKE